MEKICLKDNQRENINVETNSTMSFKQAGLHIYLMIYTIIFFVNAYRKIKKLFK